MAEIRDAYERIMGLGQEEMALLADQNMDQLGHVVMAREEAINADSAHAQIEGCTVPPIQRF